MSTRLPPKDSAESVMIEIDFSTEMAAGETISSALLSMRLVAGTDPNPGAMLAGAAAIVGRSVYQRASGGIDGNDYRLRCVAHISSGNILVRAGELPVREA
jgi:hypothetical protein